MSDKSFGFSFGDDDPEGREGGSGRPGDGSAGAGGPFGPGSPFGSGGFDPSQFSSMLSQFGEMLSNLGQSMNSPDASGPVNYDLARRLAVQQLGADPTIREGERSAAEEAVRLAEVWLDDATILPAGVIRTESWTPRQWVESTLPTWQRVYTPVARRTNEAMLENLPAEVREMMGPMMGMFGGLGSMSSGAQLGQGLGRLAPEVLTGSEIGLPLADAGIAAILPKAVTAFAEGLDQPQQQVLVFLAAREAAHQRLYAHVPWLRERMLSSVEEYAAGISIDTSGMEKLAQDFDPALLSDPQRLQEMLSADMQPTITSSNPQALERLETLLALAEGWVDVVVSAALGERLPGVPALTEAWRRRRASGSPAEQVFAQLVGLELRPRRVREAVDLWTRLGDAAGTEARDHVWDHPDLLPVAADLEAPAAFIDGILDTGDTSSDLDDPIAAIQREMEADRRRREEDQSPEGGGDQTS